MHYIPTVVPWLLPWQSGGVIMQPYIQALRNFTVIIYTIQYFSLSSWHNWSQLMYPRVSWCNVHQLYSYLYQEWGQHWQRPFFIFMELWFQIHWILPSMELGNWPTLKAYISHFCSCVYMCVRVCHVCTRVSCVCVWVFN